MTGPENFSSSIGNIRKIHGFDFARNTTYGCGGQAEVAYYPSDCRQAAALWRYLKATDTPYAVLGCGSNVLASDRFFKGAVVCMKGLSGIEKTSGGKIFCLSGTTVASLLHYCTENGLGGLEFLAGIPATVGGLVCMNGGAGGFYIGDRVSRVIIYDGKIRCLSNKNCNFGYKHSTMRDINCFILGAELCVDSSDRASVAKNTDKFLSARSNQPTGKGCGCVFKNPAGESAGKLIEKAGLKGERRGGAYVSEKHANFILNDGGSAFDVRSLIEYVKECVRSRCGVRLEEEVVYIGDFNEFDR